MLPLAVATELVRVTPRDSGFSTELLGGTLDLNAGQVIDRIGVRMGLSFPAGAQMEELARSNSEKIPKSRVSANGMSVNISGLENLAEKLYVKTGDKSLTSAFVFDYISRAIIYMSEEYEARFGRCEFVYAGGVMSNSIIKGALSERFTAHFAEPAMSADNAVGIARLALGRYHAECGK